jgi:CDP-diacylglycerol--serine O-phosphatidyltransferase
MLARALPNIFTVGNLFLGMIAILLAVKDRWDYAAIMVIIGMLLDGLDGRVARMLKTESEFGKELDSLSDVISFGVAPAVIVYVAAFENMGPEGWFLTAVFPICGALRLARFNVQPSEPGYFTGLPITAAGGILATMALYNTQLETYGLVFGTLFLSYLMVSQIKYPAFKKLKFHKSVYWIVGLFILAVAIAAIYFPKEMPKLMFIPLVLYALYGVKTSFDRKRREQTAEEAVEDVK